MIPLTFLYAPADRPELVRKALTGQADVVIIDLEDAVNARRKDDARVGLGSLIDESPQRPVQIRINALDTPWAGRDLEAVHRLPPHVEIRVPKVEGPGDVHGVASAAPNRAIHALLETPLAIERAFEIATSGVASLGLGEADLRSALGVQDSSRLTWQRARVLNAAAAAELPPPAMSVYADVADMDGLLRTTRDGYADGFLGRAAIHPRQLAVIREAFTPDPEAVRKAGEVLERFRHALSEGRGTVVLHDGTFIDPAMIRAAQRVVDVAESAIQP